MLEFNYKDRKCEVYFSSVSGFVSVYEEDTLKAIGRYSNSEEEGEVFEYQFYTDKDTPLDNVPSINSSITFGIVSSDSIGVWLMSTHPENMKLNWKTNGRSLKKGVM